jgi:UDP-N-acetyl-D-galactosamine dehydrogenase
MRGELLRDKIAVIGLGYVGLPLALQLSKNFTVFGYDINLTRISSLLQGFDTNKEESKEDLVNSIKRINLTNDLKDLYECNTYIITVPTPVTARNTPDLTLLKSACASVAKVLSAGDLVIIESTVFPGCTEEICIPILEKISKINKNSFRVGYSPERINPGDKYNSVSNVSKIIASADSEALQRMKSIYGSFITANLHVSNSIKVAETAKVLENVQRDLNIALMNELAIICHYLDIETADVINAAATKWNFIKYHPGLVGGHCIGVDPYYLADKSRKLGYSPKIILAARDLNDDMHRFVAKKILRNFSKRNPSKNVKKLKLLVLGFSFKENVSDTRNTRVFHLIKFLSKKINSIEVHDPVIDVANTKLIYPKIKFVDAPYLKKNKYDIIIVAVAHNDFLTLEINTILKNNGLIFEVSSSIFAEHNSIRL